MFLFVQFLLPLIGGLVNAALSAGSVQAQNKYNSAWAQVARLRAAGLPFAAARGITAGEQSSLPDYSGVGEGISNSIRSAIDAGALKKILADAGISSNALKVSNAETDVGLNMGWYDKDGMFHSNVATNKDIQYQAAKIALDMQKNQKTISDVATRVQQFTEQAQKDKAIAEVSRLLVQIKIGNQDFDNEARRQAAANRIYDSMAKDGLSLPEALLITVLSSIGGKIGGSAASIGF